ncbi:MAG: murein biosynthesis integral membrane protein MurJ [Verrucomicrobiae bacterium]|nr:murein biosynthesis integral membrane protein MurJ [Verrucomicrobiae bacterium]
MKKFGDDLPVPQDRVSKPECEAVLQASVTQTTSAKPMSQMLKSSGAMGAATLLSRVLGLVREQVYAGFMGDTAVASAFKLAFQVPNLFRRLLGEGALTAAFIPVFKRKEHTEGEAAMWRAAHEVMSALLVVGGALVVVVVAGISVVLFLSESGILGVRAGLIDPNESEWLHRDTKLVLQLLRIMFPYLVLVCLAALLMAMLNARGHFFVPATGAAMLNIVMIGSVLLMAPWFGKTLDTQVFALAIGVLLAGIAQVTFQIPALYKEGFRFRWASPRNSETVREVARKMVPGAIGLAAYQINVLVIGGVSFWVDRSVVASFDYAVRLMEFPQGVIGISLATYLLPTLSGLAAAKRYPDFRRTLREGLGYLLFFNLLASVLLVVLGEPIVRLLFERGRFTEASTHRAAVALICLAPGLVAFSTVNILARAFYALGDTKTPMLVSIFCLGLNLVFSLWLVGPFRQGGLGVANTMSSFFNVWLLLYALRRKLKRLEFGPLVPTAVTLLGAAVAAGLATWGVLQLWEPSIGHSTLPAKIGEVFVPAGVGTAVYAALALALRVPEAQAAIEFLKKNLKSPSTDG